MKTFNVTGSGAFPIDMLRYDVAKIVEGDSELDNLQLDTWDRIALPRRMVQVKGKACTAARWASFGWQVS